MSSESLHTKCRKCGRSVFKTDSKCPQCGASISVTQRVSPVWIVVGVLALLAFIGSIGDEPSAPSTKASSPSARSEPATPPLQLQSWSCGTEHGYIHVRGEVKNVSSGKIDNVTVVGKFYTKSGDFVKSESALIDYNPILPGQSSSFETLGTENPAITDCKISFKSLLGGSIPYTTK